MVFRMKPEKVKNRESREERFKRIASRRVQELLEKIRLLGNCSEKTNYSYNQDQVRKIFRTIEEELKRVKSLYNNPKSRESNFKL